MNLGSPGRCRWLDFQQGLLQDPFHVHRSVNVLEVGQSSVLQSILAPLFAESG